MVIQENLGMVEIRLVLFTPYGPAGARLRRGVPLPNNEVFDFPNTRDGRLAAEECRDKLNDYIKRHHGKKEKK